MATAAANRAAFQTARISVRSLRRRRLGHVGPNQNDLDKWGRKTNDNGSAPSNNLLGLGGTHGGRPAPRASLVLGGENSTWRINHGPSKHVNGSGIDANAATSRSGSTVMERQQSSAAIRRHADGASAHANGIGTKGGVPPRNADGTASDKKTNYPSDLVVVLDMDECLIHSQFLSDRPVVDYRQDEDRPATSSFGGGDNEEAVVWSACESFRVNLPDGDLVNVNKRPNLDLFLKEITSKFETYIFTAAMEVYASPVLNELDPDGSMFAGRFYREHCSYDPEMGVYAKDLCDVLRMREMMIGNASADREAMANGANDDFPCDERRVVLVDNNPLSFLPNPSNGILVSSFYDDPKDDTLEAVMELLHELDGSEDVRPILDDRFKLKEALDDIVKGASVGW